MTKKTTPAIAKKDIQKLQRAIVDGLEDVKAQDIRVFDTEHLSALFERVIIASGTSNRQTKALAASVRDAVGEAGFDKPRVEGETNGEWIIVDCSQAVVHIMQPSFRQYYNLEELWGEKPVRLKLGAVKPLAPAAVKPIKKPKTEAKTPISLKRSSAAKKGVADAFPSKEQVRKAAGAKTVAAKAPVRKVTGKTPGKTLAAARSKAPAKSPSKTIAKASARKVPAKKAVAPKS
jgi:ribosome-associated protein